LCAAGAASALALRPQLAFATPSNPASGDALVVIFLRGGADGLSMTPPIGAAFDSYAALRPTIAITPDQSLPLDSSNANAVFPQGLDGVVGLHPQLQPLYESVWANGQMAVLPASGLPDEESRTRSHFSAQEYWERGSASLSVRTGFLARLEAALNAPGPVAGVAADGNTNEILTGSRHSFNVNNLDSFGVNGFRNRARAETALRGMYTGTGLVNMEGASTLNVTGLLQSLDTSNTNFPNTRIGRDLRDVSVMLKANIGLVSAVVNTGGWDHHSELGTAVDPDARFYRRVAELGQGLRAFIDELGPAGMAETTIAVISEFGRTVDENGNGGTDHGRGGTMFLIGGGVQGGVFGNDYPDVVAEDSNNRRAFRVLTDYRQGLEEVLNTRIGVTGLFPTMTPGTTLGVARP
jgi:uncharacterized protein (DUF1501 family)